MKGRRLIFGAMVLALAASVVTYPWLPLQMPIHFDLAGRADGFAPRPVGAFLIPAVLVATFFLTYLRQSGAMRLVLSVGGVFVATLHVLVLRAALGDGTLGSTMWIACGAFLVALGLLLPRVQRNRWVGVRTPWALRSPEIWARTQRVGGYAMLAAGLVVMLSAADAGVVGSALRGGALFGSALVPVVYSWRIARPT